MKAHTRNFWHFFSPFPCKELHHHCFIISALIIEYIWLIYLEYLQNLATQSSIHQESRLFSPSALLSLFHPEESFWYGPRKKGIPFSSAFEISCRVWGLTLLEEKNLIKREPLRDRGRDKGAESSQVHQGRKLHRNIKSHLLIKRITMWICVYVFSSAIL